jgi:hypothetical protein
MAEITGTKGIGTEALEGLDFRYILMQIHKI